MRPTYDTTLLMKHTPAPWDCDGYTTLYATPDESHEIAMIEIRANVSDSGWDTVAFLDAAWPIATANAQLIAAAPRTVAALKGLLAAIDILPITIFSGSFYDALHEANNAVAVATWRTA